MSRCMFGLRLPVWQAPTGSIAGPRLARAVAAAGGMGAMALTWSSPEQAAAQVSEVLLSGGCFQVNFALAFPPTALDAALNAGASIVTFSWGDPEPYIRRVQAHGAKVGAQVTNAQGAQRFAEMGVDFLVCQGIEAGGHVQSSQALEQLLPAVLAAVKDVPVIAAGGIAEGADIARVLNIGAAGAMLGTRFVATNESGAHPDYKARLAAGDGATALTVCYDGDWPYAPHRVLRNSTLERWEAAGCPPAGARPGEGEIVGRTATGAPVLRYSETAPRDGFTGDTEAMCLYAGAGCNRINDIPSAGDLVERLWHEARPHLKRPD